jgi:hypothetical protein
MVTVPLSSLTYNHIGDPRRWSFRPRTRFRQRILFLSAPRLRLHGSTPHCTPHDFRTFSSCMLEQHLQGGSLVGALLRNLRLVLIDGTATPRSGSSRLSFAPVRLIVAHGLASRRLTFGPASSPQLGTSSPQLTTAQLASRPASSPHLGPASLRFASPRLDYSTAHARLDCHEGSSLQDMHLSPVTRLLFSCTDHDLFGFS